MYLVLGLRIVGVEPNIDTFSSLIHNDYGPSDNNNLQSRKSNERIQNNSKKYIYKNIIIINLLFT